MKLMLQNGVEERGGMGVKIRNLLVKLILILQKH